MDPTEFGSYMNSVLCRKCRGKVIPINPLKSSNWKCEQCSNIVPIKEIGHILSLIGSVMKGFSGTDFKLMYKFLTGKLSDLVPEYHETIIELKYKIVWILGYKPGFAWAGN